MANHQQGPPWLVRDATSRPGPFRGDFVVHQDPSGRLPTFHIYVSDGENVKSGIICLAARPPPSQGQDLRLCFFDSQPVMTSTQHSCLPELVKHYAQNPLENSEPALTLLPVEEPWFLNTGPADWHFPCTSDIGQFVMYKTHDEGPAITAQVWTRTSPPAFGHIDQTKAGFVLRCVDGCAVEEPREFSSLHDLVAHYTTNDFGCAGRLSALQTSQVRTLASTGRGSSVRQDPLLPSDCGPGCSVDAADAVCSDDWLQQDFLKTLNRLDAAALDAAAAPFYAPPTSATATAAASATAATPTASATATPVVAATVDAPDQPTTEQLEDRLQQLKRTQDSLEEERAHIKEQLKRRRTDNHVADEVTKAFGRLESEQSRLCVICEKSMFSRDGKPICGNGKDSSGCRKRIAPAGLYGKHIPEEWRTLRPKETLSECQEVVFSKAAAWLSTGRVDKQEQKKRCLRNYVSYFYNSGQVQQVAGTSTQAPATASGHATGVAGQEQQVAGTSVQAAAMVSGHITGVAGQHADMDGMNSEQQQAMQQGLNGSSRQVGGQSDLKQGSIKWSITTKDPRGALRLKAKATAGAIQRSFPRQIFAQTVCLNDELVTYPHTITREPDDFPDDVLLRAVDAGDSNAMFDVLLEASDEAIVQAIFMAIRQLETLMMSALLLKLGSGASSRPEFTQWVQWLDDMSASTPASEDCQIAMQAVLLNVQSGSSATAALQRQLEQFTLQTRERQGKKECSEMIARRRIARSVAGRRTLRRGSDRTDPSVPQAEHSSATCVDTLDVFMSEPARSVGDVSTTSVVIVCGNCGKTYDELAELHRTKDFDFDGSVCCMCKQLLSR